MACSAAVFSRLSTSREKKQAGHAPPSWGRRSRLAESQPEDAGGRAGREGRVGLAVRSVRWAFCRRCSGVFLILRVSPLQRFPLQRFLLCSFLLGRRAMGARHGLAVCLVWLSGRLSCLPGSLAVWLRVLYGACTVVLCVD